MAGRIWFVIGCFCLGGLIGFMAGLSISPVVNTVMGLIFAFAGGSVIILVKGRTDDELSLIGQGLTAISVAMIVGIIVGVTFRANNLLQSEKKTALQVPFQLVKLLTVEDIIKLSEKGVDHVTLSTLIKASVKGKRKEQLKFSDLEKLAEHKVHPSVIRAMVDAEALSGDSRFMLSQQDVVELKKAGVAREIIAQMLKAGTESTRNIASKDTSGQGSTKLYTGDTNKGALDRLLE